MTHVTEAHLGERARRFRSEVRALLREPAVTDEVSAVRGDPQARDAGGLAVYRALGRRGWLAVHWPECYGGLGGTMVEKAEVTRALIDHHVPDLAHVVAVDIVGTTVLEHGTEEQRKAYLPGLAAGDLLAAVLYSEPEAGSDLAALTTRAEPDGEGWRLYGRKIYSLKSHLADVAICAARTDTGGSAMHGITLFLIPLDTPGVRARAVPSISDDAFSEVVLDGVTVGADDVLGEVDDGWSLLSEILPIERTGVEFEAKSAFLLDRLAEHLAASGAPAADAAHRLVDLHARVRAAGLLSQRCVERLDAGDLDEFSTAVVKLHSTENHKALTAAGYDLLGAAAVAPDPARPGDPAAVLDHAHRDAPGFTLSAGTSEIMLQLLAAAITRSEEHAGDPADDHAGSRDSDPRTPADRWEASLEALREPRLRAVLSRLAPPPAPDPLWEHAARSLAAWAAELPASRAALADTARRTAETTLRAPLAATRAARLVLADAGVDLAATGAGDTWIATAVPDGTLRVQTDGGTARVDGRVEVDLDGAERVLLVGEATPDGPGDDTRAVALVGVGDPGVRRTPRSCVDGRTREVLDLDGVAVPAGCWGRADGAATEATTALAHAAQLVGTAWTAHRMAVDHARRRRQFGRTIAGFQAAGFALAMQRVGLEVAQALVDDLAFRLDRGLDVALEARETAVVAADTARAATTHAVQVHGAQGMRRDHDAQLLYLRATVDAASAGRGPRLRAEAAELLLTRARAGLS